MNFKKMMKPVHVLETKIKVLENKREKAQDRVLAQLDHERKPLEKQLKKLESQLAECGTKHPSAKALAKQIKVLDRQVCWLSRHHQDTQSSNARAEAAREEDGMRQRNHGYSRAYRNKERLYAVLLLLEDEKFKPSAKCHEAMRLISARINVPLKKAV